MSEVVNNREQRITQLKTIIRHLHEGRPADEVRAMLASGTHPLGVVRQRLASLAPGRVLHVVSTFRPVPLIDTLGQEGYAVHVAEDGPGQFVRQQEETWLTPRRLRHRRSRTPSRRGGLLGGGACTPISTPHTAR